MHGTLVTIDNYKNLHVPTIATEVDSFTKAIVRDSLTSILRNAYDNEYDGRKTWTSGGLSVWCRMYWNVLLAGTYGAFAKLFKVCTDGTVCRTTFVEVKQELGARMPIWRKLSKAEDAHIQRLCDKALALAFDEEGNIIFNGDGNINTVRLNMDYLYDEIDKWQDEYAARAIKEVNWTLDDYRKRATVSAFRVGMICDWLFRQERSIKQAEREKRVTAIVLYYATTHLENMLRLFPDANDPHTPKPQTSKRGELYDELPDTFSTADVNALKAKYNIRSEAKEIAKGWKQAGLIEQRQNSENKYVKIKKDNGNN